LNFNQKDVKKQGMKKFLNSIKTKFLATETKKRLAENFLSLSILQGLNYILPLITLPYLVRVLGPEKYGLIAFAQAFIGYFMILTDYGFNLSATREISINREDKQKVSEIFSSVLTIKFFLCILSFLILVSLLFIPKFKKDWLVYIFTFGMVLGNVLFPIWFFQGIEKMRYITILNIVAKSIFTVCIFIFIKKMSDFVYVPLINSLGYLVAGMLSLRIVFINFAVKFVIPSLEGIKHQLKEGWHIFISTVAISLYTISNTFILGLFTNNTIVGYYAAAEKIIRVIQSMLTPISQTVYPYISKLASESKEKALNFIKKLLKIIGLGSFIISFLIFIFSTQIVYILLGSHFQNSIIVLKILAFLPFIIGLSNVMGIQTMLTFGMKEVFSKIIISAGIINICLTLLLTPIFYHIGTSVSVLLTEIFVTFFMFVYLRNILFRREVEHAK
jgi:PST family polysaccharide transporter